MSEVLGRLKAGHYPEKFIELSLPVIDETQFKIPSGSTVGVSNKITSLNTHKYYLPIKIYKTKDNIDYIKGNAIQVMAESVDDIDIAPAVFDTFPCIDGTINFTSKYPLTTKLYYANGQEIGSKQICNFINYNLDKKNNALITKVNDEKIYSYKLKLDGISSGDKIVVTGAGMSIELVLLAVK